MEYSGPKSLPYSEIDILIMKRDKEITFLRELYCNKSDCRSADLYKNNEEGYLIYFRYWMEAHGSGQTSACYRLDKVGDLKSLLKKDAGGNNLTKSDVESICEECKQYFK